MKSIICFIVVAIVCSSCGYGRFLETEERGSISELFAENKDQHVLKMDDKVTVSVWDHNDVSLGSIFSIYSANESFGKWVLIDSLGYATLPKLGRVQMGGLNCKEAADVITSMLKKDLVDPIVVVKILNREVTVLGEVKTTGNFIIDKEHTAIYEMLGKSEGFLQYADTRNVQLIRNNRSYRIDLSKKDALASHRIYVKSGDILFIPAKSGKNFDLAIKRVIPFASAITAIAVLISLLK
ncbi:MAG: polysaccharide biosynthesis/export family protein [Crocinitomicaceae bacterium]|nr:polysaccharide biosynthesis/export family protein [Crocinitomicaceae bacterium]